jgi:hypothetical protein
VVPSEILNRPAGGIRRIRGGGSTSEQQEEGDTPDDTSTMEAMAAEEQAVRDATSLLSMEQEEATSTASAVVTDNTDDNRLDSSLPLKRRRTSDIILKLQDSPSSRTEPDKDNTAKQDHFHNWSDQLRVLIMERRNEILKENQQQQKEEEEQQQQHAESEKPHRNPVSMVKSLLHKLAPKIPAIKLSPDVSLAVRALPGDGDSGVAASLVATLSHVWEVVSVPHNMPPGSTNPHGNATGLVARELVNDRRFEQLIETILCGLDMDKRLQEASAWQEQEEFSNDLVLLMNDASIHEGLSIRDACRAAWGLAMLGMYDVKQIGETKVKDLLIALALHVRELLLARIRLLCQDDFFVENNSTISVEDRISQIVSEIAEDTATVLWVFGCVQAVTSIQCGPLVHVCALILYNNPYQLRDNVQEHMATLAEPVVGGNDVIDKLDRAERVNAAVYASPERSKDIFLDFLSPTEITDVLWALGIYGMKESYVLESISLLSDIAVDRVVEWLRHDLQHNGAPNYIGDTHSITNPEENLGRRSTINANERMTGNDGYQRTDASGEQMTDMSDRLNEAHARDDGSIVDGVTSEYEYVHVVDAVTVLDSEKKEIDVKDTLYDSLSNESLNTVDAATLIQAEELFEHGGHSLVAPDQDPLAAYLQDKESSDWIFSAHDLCSISWAATELRDSIKSQTTQMVADLMVTMGRDHLSECSSADHVNLIWALAKEANEQPSRSSSNIHLLGRWIAESVYQSSGLADAIIDSDSWSLLRDLQPPELSRLLWSLATLSMTFEDEALSNLAGILSLAGLETASRNFHMFSIEDLARISWAFVECSDYTAVLETHPSSFQSLGHVLGLIDVSLSNWQAGLSHATPGRHGKGKELSREENRFISFFGRARSHLFRVERKMEETGTEEMEDYPLPSLLEEKVHLPFLKDFPIDPSTLCKLCGSLNKPDSMFSRVCDTQTMAKVIIRLMTSRNGRLLGECHVNDLASLCIAALSLTKSSNREIVGLFTRRTVKIFNENPSIMASATPPVLSKLICALGDLGIKYHPEVDSALAYRRLQLTARLPIREGFDVEGLSNDSLISLVSG